MPATVEEFELLAGLSSDTPQGAAALMLIALKVFTGDEEAGSEMFRLAVSREREWRRGGPGAREVALVRTQLRKQPYIPDTYFGGTAPENGYRLQGPPFVLEFTSNEYSDQGGGRYKVFVRCSGADSPRPVTCVRRADGTWAVEEWSSLLLGVRDPG
jgi:hypothetical protein